MPTACSSSWASILCPPAVPAVLGETSLGLQAEGRERPQLHTCVVSHWVAASTFLTRVTVCDQTSDLVLPVTCCLLQPWCNDLPSDRAAGGLFSCSVAHKLETSSWRPFAASLARILLGWRGTVLASEVLGGSALAEAKTRLAWSIFEVCSVRGSCSLAASSSSDYLNIIVWMQLFK